MNKAQAIVTNHLDFSGLVELKAKAKKNEEGVAREVGQKFEAMFVQMVLKSMRDANATLKSGLLDSSTLDTFEQMYHGELSQAIAKREALGIGNWLLSAMEKNGQIEKARQSAVKSKSYVQEYEKSTRPEKVVAQLSRSNENLGLPALNVMDEVGNNE